MDWPTHRPTLTLYTQCTLTFSDLLCQDCLILHTEEYLLFIAAHLTESMYKMWSSAHQFREHSLNANAICSDKLLNEVETLLILLFLSLILFLSPSLQYNKGVCNQCGCQA